MLVFGLSCTLPEASTDHAQEDGDAIPGITANEPSSSLLSQLVLYWLHPMLSIGQRNKITLEDLKPILADPAAVYAPMEVAGEATSVEQGNSLFRDLLRALPLAVHLRIFTSGVLALVDTGLRIAQPIIIAGLVKYLQGGQHPSVGAWLILALFFDFVIIALVQARGYQFMTQVSYHIRSYLIYRVHCRSIQPVDYRVTGANENAKVTVLADSDVGTIVGCIANIFELLTCAVTVSVGAYLLHQLAGIAFLGPFLLCLCSFAVPIALGSKISSSQNQMLEATEKRLNAVSLLISNSRSIRMGGIQEIAADEAQGARRLETTVATFNRKMELFQHMANSAVDSLSVLAIFGLYSLIKGASNLDYVTLFMGLAIVSMVIGPFNTVLNLIPTIYRAIPCWKRLSEYLSPPPGYFAAPTRSLVPPDEKSDDPDVVVRASGASLGWNEKAALESISFTLTKGSITLISGETGSGKSTLMKALVGEVGVLAGSLGVRTRNIGFSDQVPFFMPSKTVRDQILLGREVDEWLYNGVIKACDMAKDIERWPDGDSLTLLDTQGSPLSGGQRKRLSLARALYHKPELLVLDDVFTGLDPHTVRTIRKELFAQDGFIHKMLKSTAIVISSGNEPTVLKDIPFTTLRASNGTIIPQLEGEIIWGKDPDDDETNTSSADGTNISDDTEMADGCKPETSPGPESEDMSLAVPTPLRKDFDHYARSLGRGMLAGSVAIMLVAVAVEHSGAFWLAHWAGTYQSGDTSRSAGFYLGIFALLGGVAQLSIAVGLWLQHIVMVPRSSNSTHQHMLNALTRAPITFIEKRSSEILNRFTQDLELIDWMLPLALFNSIYAVACVLVSVCTLAVGSPFTLITLTASAGMLWLIGRRYSATASQLRTLMVAARAPLTEGLQAAFDGRCTIRAFGLEESTNKALMELIQHSYHPNYLWSSLRCWLNCYTALITAVIAGTLVALLVGLQSQVNVGWSGVALINTVALAFNMQLLVYWLTTLEGNLGSAARTREFSAGTPHEDGEDQSKSPPDENWPTRGKIRFDNLCCRHGDMDILKNVTATIHGGEKVALVGRTGSGKSSLIQALFGLLPRTQGTITIGSRDISTIPASILRDRLVGSPQQVFCSAQATVRKNLDPAGTSSDATISTLTNRIFEDVEDFPGLDLDATWQSQEFSAGWQQRLGLVRALLRKGRRIYMFDESTSGLPLEVHKRVMGVVFEEVGKESTVVVVTHHLGDLGMFDRVLEVVDGAVWEVVGKELEAQVAEEKKKGDDITLKA
ncbi:P-loop containing nucleoside triphosphate hydrolase protein [Immersiella caudata]|uniref:P-loop containing nucleoside triphosphate hydrolase protein n=1 Tax=Immersiella caudata TaxID=314043 RepID=A0AA39WYE1_9PEZI|nr:P-loop containing nucleoside triphosphate hydrolase protein [Immersiella caudata]